MINNDKDTEVVSVYTTTKSTTNMTKSITTNITKSINLERKETNEAANTQEAKINEFNCYIIT